MNYSQNSAILFLVETLKRFFTKSPKYFRVWQIVLGILVLGTGLPDILSFFGWHVSELFEPKLNAIVSWCSRGALVMSFLGAQSAPVAITEDGDILKKTDGEKLPFTSKVEKKSLGKSLAQADVSDHEKDGTASGDIGGGLSFEKPAAPKDDSLL